MNKNLSIVLRDRLLTLPFVDLISGMVQTVTKNDVVRVTETTEKTITKRFPVSDDVIGVNCQGVEIAMTPETKRKSIIYFEDFGVTATERKRGVNGYQSSIRLICWLNRANIVADKYAAISGAAMALIIDKVSNSNPVNVDIFTTLTVNIARIQQQDAGLFGRYTYSETERQYLRPPYEFFGLDLSCNYYVSNQCITQINWNQSPICQ